MRKDNYIFFLGTAGTRFNVINQSRHSGGLWVNLGGVNTVVDPGPGSLVQICANRPEIGPDKIDALLLTHRHLDHSGDMNILAEAMTSGGKKKYGFVGLSPDSIDEEPVLYGYLQRRIERIVRWDTPGPIDLNESIHIDSLPLRHHGVDCYGLKFSGESFPTWGIISDTAYIDELSSFYSDCELIIANVTLLRKVKPIEHLSISDIESLLKNIRPAKLIMTHFGTKLLEEPLQEIAKKLTTEYTEVIAAEDGMTIPLVSSFHTASV